MSGRFSRVKTREGALTKKKIKKWVGEFPTMGG